MYAYIFYFFLRLRNLLCASVFSLFILSVHSYGGNEVSLICNNQLTTHGPLDITGIAVGNNQALDQENGLYGGHRIRMSNSGGAMFPRRQGANQGDVVMGLNYPLLLMGEREAGFFGFQRISNGQYTVPDIDEINGAIQTFNDGLDPSDPRRILISFYPVDEAFGSNIDYRRRFTRNFQLPMATTGRQFLHDITGHALQGFFLPNHMLELMRDRFQIWEDFLTYMQENFPNQPTTDFYERLDQRVSSRLNRNIDEFGNFIGAFYTPVSRYVVTPAHAELNPEVYVNMVSILYESPLRHFTKMFSRNSDIKRSFETWYPEYAETHQHLVRQGIRRANLISIIAQLQAIYAYYGRSWSRDVPLSIIERNSFSRSYTNRIKRLREILERSLGRSE